MFCPIAERRMNMDKKALMDTICEALNIIEASIQCAGDANSVLIDGIEIPKKEAEDLKKKLEKLDQDEKSIECLVKAIPSKFIQPQYKNLGQNIATLFDQIIDLIP